MVAGAQRERCFSLSQLQKDRSQLTEMQETVEQQSKTIKRFNRGGMESLSACPPPVLNTFLLFLISKVSVMAAQEYDGMKEQLDLEQNLRVQAESFAHEVISGRGAMSDSRLNALINGMSWIY